MQCNCLKYNYLIFRTPLKEFPTAKSLSKISGGVYDVLGSEHESIGKIVLSSFYSSGITGFAGPTPLMKRCLNMGGPSSKAKYY